MSDKPYAIGGKKWPGLSKVIEESGELAQVLGKIIGNEGKDIYWTGLDLRAKLIEEIGDLMAIVDFFIDKNLTKEEKIAILKRANYKDNLYKKWHNDFDGSLDEFTSQN